MYFYFTAYIFIYKYMTCFPWMYFTTIQRAIYHFLPDLVLHLFTFLCSPIIIFFTNLNFIKWLCTHDFSRVTFATELSTNLVYKYFFIDYNYISINLLFFFTVKLSIFSRLCVKQKRAMSRSTHRDKEILHWFKKTVLYRINIGRYWEKYPEFLVSDRYRFWKSGIEPALSQTPNWVLINS